MSDFQVVIGYENNLIGEALKRFVDEHPGCISKALTPLKDLDHRLSNLPFEDLIIILEVKSPDGQLISKIQALHNRRPLSPIIVVTSICDHLQISQFMEADVSGLILLDCCSIAEVSDCLTKVIGGSNFYCPVATKMLFSEYRKKVMLPPTLLTQREYEILLCLAEGDQNKMIAGKLSISESTVKTHRKNIMKKLNAFDLLSLVRNAFKLNLLSSSEVPCCSSIMGDPWSHSKN